LKNYLTLAEFHRATSWNSCKGADGRDMKKKRVEPAKYFAPVSEISVGYRRDCIQLIVAFVSILSRMQECRGIEPRDNVRNSQAAVCKHFWPLNVDQLLLSQYPCIRIFQIFRKCGNAFWLCADIYMRLFVNRPNHNNANRVSTFNMLALSISATWCLLCCTPQILALILS